MTHRDHMALRYTQGIGWAVAVYLNGVDGVPW